MDMTLRWYGPGYDSVTLKQIRQIPGLRMLLQHFWQAGRGVMAARRDCRA